MKLRFIVFLEILAMFICGLIHLTAIILNKNVPLKIYGLMGIVVLIAGLLTVFIIEPFANWFIFPTKKQKRNP